MGTWILSLLIFGTAGWFIYSSMFKNKSGSCGGCSKCGCSVKSTKKSSKKDRKNKLE